MDKTSANLPAWDNSSEYKGIHSPDFDQDLEAAKKYISEINELNKELEPLFFKKEWSPHERKTLIQGLQEVAQKNHLAAPLIYNLGTFAHCELSLDLKNQAAQKFNSEDQQLRAQYEMALVPSDIFLQQCEEAVLNEYLQAEHTRPAAFSWQHKRKQKYHMLSAEEEKTISQLSPYATQGWGDLYDQISGTLRVHVPSKGTVGVAEAAGLLRGADEKLRKEAWQGLQAAWQTVEIPCAAIINNLVGYRKEIYRKRSHTKPMHYLDVPLHGGYIERETLDAMMSVLSENIEMPRRALKAMAKSLNKTQIDPWDILAPSPRLEASSFTPFSDGLAMVREAFASVSPAMGAFVDTMAKNNWIEARILPNKGPGAHCTGFLKSKTPRVFQSYMGSLKDISTLAHELGHAYHGWVMRDLNWEERDYPVTVAETASTFSETLLSEQLFAKAKGSEKFTLAWEEASDAVLMLINIPARFEFEKNLYEAREHGPLTPKELNALTNQAWRKWYGDQISQNEEQYWMTKMHFSFSGISFYNFPYTFGYLFSLGIYATKEKLGDKFHQAYVDLLRDSGRMTAEDLVKKHLGADIRKPQFWQESLNIVARKIKAFEELALS